MKNFVGEFFGACSISLHFPGLNNIYETNQINPNDAIKSIVEESSRKKKLSMKAWTAEIFYKDGLVDDSD